MAEIVRVRGLREFRAGLKAINRGLPKTLRVAFNEAADSVVKATRARVPKRTGRAASSVRASSTQKLVRVAEGSSRAPYMPWLDYGGSVGRRQATRRDFVKSGRYLYPVYFEKRDSGEFERDMSRALIRTALEAGIEVR